MLQTAIKSVAVVMQRRAISNRWQSEVWEALAVPAGGNGRVVAMALSRARAQAASFGSRGLLPQRIGEGAEGVRPVAHGGGRRGAAVRHGELRRGEPLDGR